MIKILNFVTRWVTIIYLFCPLSSLSQETFQGTIISQTSSLGIAYASIGLVKTNQGTNADELGHFIFQANNKQNDTLIFSCVGFLSKKIAVNDFKSGGIVSLYESQSNLPVISILSKKAKDQILNDYQSAGFNQFGNIGVTKVLAQHFKAPKDNMKLKKIKLSKVVGQCRFIIRIFSIDTLTKKPGVDLLDTLVQVNSKGKNLIIDLEKFNIVIKEKDFFVGVQWLFFDENIQIVKSSIGGRKIVHQEYLPTLFIDERKSIETQDLGCWQLDFREKWTLASETMRLKMAATLGN